ncbi:hypothetical protein OAZ15_05505 [Pelagibacteraceae bacterium]|nr:hypothetical protein [Pelagibacteraceae bacterium]
MFNTLLTRILKKIQLKNFENFISFKLYKINFFLINLFKPQYANYFNHNYCKELKIDVDNNFLNIAINDLNNKQRKYFNEKNKKNFLYYDYPTDYLEQINLAWNLDNDKYIEFFDKNFGKIIKKIYNNNNYRIEHIFLYETINTNSKLTYNLNSNFHCDNDFPGALKVIIYLCDVDEKNGPFVYKNGINEKKVIGKKGTSIIFQQNNCLHAASNTVLNKRIAISYLIYPSLRSNLNYLKDKSLNVLCLKNPFSQNV